MHRLWLWIEGASALAAFFLATLTLVVPDWLEAFGLNPDEHTGANEWLTALAFGALSAILARLAYRNRRRLRTTGR